MSDTNENRPMASVLHYVVVENEPNGKTWELVENQWQMSDTVAGLWAPDYPTGTKMTVCAVVEVKQ